MIYSLPELDKEAIPLSHFPTKHQAFIFRAYEYVPAQRIAEVLETTAGNVRRSAHDMGLPEYEPGDVWLKKGYITIIRSMWHILPYDQLLKLLGMTEQTLAMLIREEDFLFVKLSKKPICEPVKWRELTDDEKKKTARIKEILSGVSIEGKKPFEFEYNVPKMRFFGKERFKTRMIYAFSGLYQQAFDVDSREYLPDELLKAYQNLGINGIWTQGILSQLAEFPFMPSVSDGYEMRIERMRKLCERLSSYGIKLYLYINEPRSLPLEFFEEHPSLRGHIRESRASLCTSTRTVQNYLKDAIESICKAVPMLGGFFMITRSENQTNCYSHSGDGYNTPCLCPRCSKKSAGEVIAKTIECVLEGARRVSDDIKVFAWSWRWLEYYEDIIRHLPKDVILFSQSERDIPFEIGGCKGNVVDYSMSIIGPGEVAKKQWESARNHGNEVGAKVQINTTWEASTVPAIPVLPSIEEHIRRLSNEGVEHLLLSWTLGGYPCKNVAAAAKYFYEGYECDESEGNLEAQMQFSKAFSEFPFHVQVLYKAPQNAGPSNLLYEKPTGYTATMTCYSYDDVESWRAIYPADVLESQFAKLCDGWEKGLDMLDQDAKDETALMARATYCLFKSTLDQIRFVRARDESRYADMVALAKSELETAKRMLSLMNENAAIGYEAANHYYFSKGQLIEKILNCNYLIDTYGDKA